MATPAVPNNTVIFFGSIAGSMVAITGGAFLLNKGDLEGVHRDLIERRLYGIPAIFVYTSVGVLVGATQVGTRILPGAIDRLLMTPQ